MTHCTSKSTPIYLPKNKSIYIYIFSPDMCLLLYFTPYTILPLVCILCFSAIQHRSPFLLPNLFFFLLRRVFFVRRDRHVISEKIPPPVYRNVETIPYPPSLSPVHACRTIPNSTLGIANRTFSVPIEQLVHSVGRHATPGLHPKPSNHH